MMILKLKLRCLIFMSVDVFSQIILTWLIINFILVK